MYKINKSLVVNIGDLTISEDTAVMAPTVTTSKLNL